MSYSVFEHTLARLLTDETFLLSYLKNPESTLRELDLIADEKLALLEINTNELKVAARSFMKKRAHRQEHKKRSLWKRLFSSRLLTF